MPKVLTNNVNLYYEDTEKGDETIVFSHGLLWSCRMFDKQIEILKKDFRNVAYDHRGQGKTEVSKSGYDMDTLTDDAISLIEYLKIAPVHFAGLSMGGFIGMRIASRRPDLIKSLILIDTTADPEPEENIPKYKRLNFIGRWFGLRLVTKPVMKIMFSKTTLNDPNRSQERKYWKKQLISNHRKGITRATKGVINRKGIFDELKNIKCPTLIIVGEEDVATVPAKSEKMHEAIERSKLVYIPKAGHSSTMEQPEKINETIFNFLNN